MLSSFCLIKKLSTSALQKRQFILHKDTSTEKQQYILGNTGNTNYASEYNVINIEQNLSIIPNNTINS